MGKAVQRTNERAIETEGEREREREKAKEDERQHCNWMRFIRTIVIDLILLA